MLNVLNSITSTYMIAKYTIVFTHASDENINLKPVISASNMFATITLINCDATVPRTIPTASEITPISIVSMKRISDIFLFPMPSIIYIPNSLLRLFIRNLLAYIIRNPNINDTNTLTPERISVISFIISYTDELTLSITVWLSIALNT